jgi:hypothetical protein
MPHVPEPFGPGKISLARIFQAIEKQIRSSDAGRRRLTRELQSFVKRAQKLLTELEETRPPSRRR